MTTDVASSVASLMLRELQALRLELDAYPDEDSVWAQPASVPNSAGTLALHIAGNLRYFIGSCLGRSGYVRDRSREFEARSVRRAVLLEEVAEAESAIQTVLQTLTERDLAAPFPEAVGGHSMVTGDFLMHLCSHLAYHLGQIDYHRRIVTGQRQGVGALPLTGLRTARRTASA